MAKKLAAKKVVRRVASPTATASVGDCVSGMAALAAGSVHLVVADPPYNYKVKYDKCQDNLSEAAYLRWSEDWLREATRALHATGSLWLFAPDELVSELDVLCKTKFGLHKRRTVIWFFTFGQAASKNFTKSHVNLLYYTRNAKQFTFNAGDVKVPSARQLVYKDARGKKGGKLPDDCWALLKRDFEAGIDPTGSLWLESRVCGSFNERSETPNQLPVRLVERIVLATSNVGDVVLDPCCGSGSVGVAALKHGRSFIGFDLSADYVNVANRRIAEVLSGS